MIYEACHDHHQQTHQISIHVTPMPTNDRPQVKQNIRTCFRGAKFLLEDV